MKNKNKKERSPKPQFIVHHFEIKLSFPLHACASCCELPSDISNMVKTNESFNIVAFLFGIKRWHNKTLPKTLPKSSKLLFFNILHAI